jgi:hypothetical protein
LEVPALAMAPCWSSGVSESVVIWSLAVPLPLLLLLLALSVLFFVVMVCCDHCHSFETSDCDALPVRAVRQDDNACHRYMNEHKE